MSDRHTISPYPIRMSAELRDRLESSAKAGSRSLHAEIIARLEASYQYVPQSRDISIEAGIKELSELSQKIMIADEMRAAKLQAVIALEKEMRKPGSAEKIAALQAAHMATSAEMESLTQQKHELGERYYTLRAQVSLNSKAPKEE